MKPTLYLSHARPSGWFVHARRDPGRPIYLREDGKLYFDWPAFCATESEALELARGLGYTVECDARPVSAIPETRDPKLP